MAERLSTEQYHKYLDELHDKGVRVDCSNASFARLGELRMMYEPFITSLSIYFEFMLPPVIVDELPIDNWQLQSVAKKFTRNWIAALDSAGRSFRVAGFAVSGVV